MRLRLAVFAVEAIRMVERGEATAEDIDQAMKLGAGYRESCGHQWMRA